ncbi:non-specific serine,threonine protein kinase [Sarracenia purpurea var. burkii]
MAPEYVIHGQFSVKSDVFSYGVVVLEIVSGQKNNCFRNGEYAKDLLNFAWRSWKQGTCSNFIDPTLRAAASGFMQEMMRCIHIGLLCVQENVAERPTMASVVLMLNSVSLTLSLPSQPAFFLHSTVTVHPEVPLVDDNKPAVDSSGQSINEASITELNPR